MSQVKGKVVQVIGSTLDAEFPENQIPEIYNALVLERDIMGEKVSTVCEVQQHLGGNRVRAVALASTDGIQLTGLCAGCGSLQGRGAGGRVPRWAQVRCLGEFLQGLQQLQLWLQ